MFKVTQHNNELMAIQINGHLTFHCTIVIDNGLSVLLYPDMTCVPGLVKQFNKCIDFHCHFVQTYFLMYTVVVCDFSV